MPCNSDPAESENFLFGRSSANWKGLDSNGVHLMMALKPVEELYNTRGIFSAIVDTVLSRRAHFDLCFPENMTQLKLDRLFRCTQNILSFYELIVKHMKRSYFNNHSIYINSSSTSSLPGHEIYGDIPEILLLPQNVYGQSLKEVFTTHQCKEIVELIKRVHLKYESQQVTVIDESGTNLIFLRHQFGSNVVFKTINECRGLEFPILVTITADSNWECQQSIVIDSWTRVSTALFIIHVERKYSNLTSGLKEAIDMKVAKSAEEQENIEYGCWEQLYISIQHPIIVTMSKLAILVFQFIRMVSIFLLFLILIPTMILFLLIPLFWAGLIQKLTKSMDCFKIKFFLWLILFLGTVALLLSAGQWSGSHVTANPDFKIPALFDPGNAQDVPEPGYPINITTPYNLCDSDFEKWTIIVDGKLLPGLFVVSMISLGLLLIHVWKTQREKLIGFMRLSTILTLFVFYLFQSIIKFADKGGKYFLANNYNFSDNRKLYLI